jgi:hypothetical protein
LEEGEVLTDMEKFNEHMSSIQAVIEPVGQAGAKVTAMMVCQGTDWLLEYEGLPPGIYRLTVGTVKSGPLAPSPIHDLFQVVTTA